MNWGPWVLVRYRHIQAAPSGHHRCRGDGSGSLAHRKQRVSVGDVSKIDDRQRPLLGMRASRGVPVPEGSWVGLLDQIDPHRDSFRDGRAILQPLRERKGWHDLRRSRTLLGTASFPVDPDGKPWWRGSGLRRSQKSRGGRDGVLLGRASPASSPEPGSTSSKSTAEGMNLCVKKVKRAGRGSTSFRHYRLRVLLHAGGVTWGTSCRDIPSSPPVHLRS